MQIRIRKTTDHELLLRLDTACFPHDERIDPTEGVWWVAYHYDTPVGFAGAKVLAQPLSNVRGVDTGKGVFLARCGIIPMYRGVSLQRRLIRVRLSWARAQRAKRAITYTAYDNVASTRNLQKEGFLYYLPVSNYSGMKDALYWMLELW